VRPGPLSHIRRAESPVPGSADRGPGCSAGIEEPACIDGCVDGSARRIQMQNPEMHIRPLARVHPGVYLASYGAVEFCRLHIAL
jgi:hypothetical protein